MLGALCVAPRCTAICVQSIQDRLLLRFPIGLNEALETETVDLLTNKTVISNSYFISDHRVIPKVSVFNSTSAFKVSMVPLKENVASTFSVMLPPAAT